MVVMLIGWSKGIFIMYFQKFQSLLSQFMTYWLQNIDPQFFQESELKIGGPGCVVQIIKSAFGHQKYNWGHYVDIKWVFGGIHVQDDARRRQQGKEFLLWSSTTVQGECYFLSLRSSSVPVQQLCWMDGLLMTRLRI